MPAPTAVPRRSSKRSIAAYSASRSMVGACTSSAAEAKATMPICTSAGWLAMNCLAASCEATMRLGSTSSARIEPETSIARITVPRDEASVITAAGRATARISTVMASSSSAGGTCRRQPSPLPIACLTMREVGVAHRALLLAPQHQT